MNQRTQFSGEITCKIDPPELKIGKATKHHEYRIHGTDQMGEFDVWRRYSDFVVLKKHMMTRWPGVYINSLPEKKFIGNNEQLFLEFRQEGLANFLTLITQQKHLWYGDEFQLFIKSKSSQVDKFLSNIGKTNNREIAIKYHAKFGNQLKEAETSSPQNDVLKVNEFRAYLKSALTILQRLQKVSQIMAEQRKKYNEKYQTLITNILPTYQGQCISTYCEDRSQLYFFDIKGNGLNQIHSNLSVLSQRNAMAIISELIKEQARQIQNFQEILQNKEEYQSVRFKLQAKKRDLQLEEVKINAGKESLFNMIKKATKQEQLNQNKILLERCTQEVQDAEQICKTINRILAQDHIKRFKQARKKQYYSIIKEIANVQKKSLELQEQFWIKIGKQQANQSENDKPSTHETKTQTEEQSIEPQTKMEQSGLQNQISSQLKAQHEIDQ